MASKSPAEIQILKETSRVLRQRAGCLNYLVGAIEEACNRDLTPDELHAAHSAAKTLSSALLIARTRLPEEPA
jgi:hypothetical protein